MSLSQPTLKNPAQHFFQWSGSKGNLTWYDRENKKEVLVRLPFEFIVLDELATITGYSKQNESGYWSNEVRNVSKDELYVRTKKGPFEMGLYADLTQTRSKGGKYAKSIYIAHKIGNEWVIGNLRASGSSLNAWIEFGRTHDVQSGKVSMTRGEQQDAPTGAFFPPVFTAGKWRDDEYDIALELDKELQKYLGIYLSAPKVDEDAHSIDLEEGASATPEQVEDFERRKGMTVDDLGGEPINLDDIPF